MGRRYPRIGQRLARTLDHDSGAAGQSGGGGNQNGSQQGGETGALTTVGVTGAKANQPNNRFTGKSQAGGGAPNPDAGQSTVSVGSAVIALNATTTVTFQAKDVAGNNITQGGATVIFGTSGGASTVSIGSVTDNADGTYTATATGSGAGFTATTVTANVNGVDVSSTLPTIRVYTSPTVTAASPNTAQSNTTITLTVTNADPLMAVAFGSVDATVLSVDSATQVTVRHPAQSSDGSVDITVGNSGLSSKFTNGAYYCLPPSIHSIWGFEGSSDTASSGSLTGTLAGGKAFIWNYPTWDRDATIYESGSQAARCTMSGNTDAGSHPQFTSSNFPSPGYVDHLFVRYSLYYDPNYRFSGYGTGLSNAKLCIVSEPGFNGRAGNLNMGVGAGDNFKLIHYHTGSTSSDTPLTAKPSSYAGTWFDFELEYDWTNYGSASTSATTMKVWVNHVLDKTSAHYGSFCYDATKNMNQLGSIELWGTADDNDGRYVVIDNFSVSTRRIGAF